MTDSTNDFLWCEKYRPQEIKNCVMPNHTKSTLSNLAVDNIQHLLFTGSAGTGKTTAALALCKQLKADSMLINASLEGNIDLLRDKIADFASTVSLTGGRKVVILDEIDHSTPKFQPALRAFMEKFSSNCIFILTANHKSRIIDPVQSRCSVIDFVFSQKEKPLMSAQIFKRLCFILDTEGIEYKKSVVAELVKNFFPDFRRMVNEVQKYARAGGVVDSGVLTNLADSDIAELVSYIKNKDFGKTRKWVAQNSDKDAADLFNSIYENLYTVGMKADSIPRAVLIINEYSYKSCFVANQEINTVACMVELMCEVEFEDG